MTTSDKPPREENRVEYSGAEQLDRVLIHLREARERTPRKGKSAGRAPLEQEKVAFREEIGASAAVQQPQEAERAAVSDPLRQAEASNARPPRQATEGEPLHAEAPASNPASRTARRLAQALQPKAEAPPAHPASVRPTAKQSGPPSSNQPSTNGDLYRSVLSCAPAFRGVAWFSFASNILMLAGPLFMLQVYDRVMTSGSMPTLVALFALTAAIYVVIGLLEFVRSRVLVRVGIDIDRRLSDRVFAAGLRRSLAQPGSSLSALREFDQLRQFVAGPGPLAFFDAPWTPVYLLVIFLTHWTLGIAATLASALLLLLAWATEVRSREALTEATKASHRSLELAESGQRNAEAITAMGMLSNYRGRWQQANGEAMAWQVLAADRLTSMSSLSKALRLLLQSLMLAIGAALAISGQISAGAIIAATIIFGRALAPVEQIVGQWRSFVKARESYEKIEELLKAHPEQRQKMSLPKPKGQLEARGLRVGSPDGRTLILSNVSFAVAPGQMLAVIGPSASGKSTLARTLVGLWPTSGGEVLIDGARLDQWNGEELGAHIGYLPQNVELFSGTIRENIARFDPDATDQGVIEAARAAHAHDMIVALPKGYDTELGAFGTYLSAGQRQRIGLARALYGDPALVVLDEPNANLDRTGDEALASAIDGMRARKRAVVLISHRVQAIGKADLLLYLERGQQRAFGPREDVLRYLQQGQAPQQTRAAPANAPRPGVDPNPKPA